MDQFYFEQGYLESSYFVYIGEAKIDLGPYIEGAYIDSDYWIDYGVTTAVSAELTEVLNVIVEFEAALSSTATLSAQGGRIQDVTVDWSGVFATTMTINATRDGDIDLFSDTELSSSPVANRSTAITLDNIANVNAQAGRITESAVTMAVSVTVDADVEDVILFQATFPQVQTTINTSKYLGDFIYSSGRPRTFTGGTYDSSEKKFGTHSLAGFVEQTFTSLTPDWAYDWAFEFWDKDIRDGCDIDLGFFRITPFSSTDRRHRFVARNSAGSEFLSQVSPTPSIGAWDHWAVVKTGNRVSYYLNGTRWYTSDPGAQTLKASDTLLIGIGGTLGGGSPNRIDEVSLWIGDTLGWNANNSSITVPTAARVNNRQYTQALWHFDGNGVDDTVIVIPSGQIDLFSGFNDPLTVPVEVTKGIDSDLVVESTQSTAAVKTVDQTQSLTTTITASIDGTVLKSAEASLESQSSLSCDISRLIDQPINVTGQFDISVTSTGIRVTAGNFDSDALQTTVGNAIKDSLSTQLVAFDSSMSVNANRLGETQLVSSCDISIVASKTIGVISNQNVAANLVILAGKSADAIWSQTVSLTLTSDIGLLEISTASLSTVSQITVDVTKFKGSAVSLGSSFVSQAQVNKTVDIVKTLTSTVSANFSVNVNPSAPLANPVYSSIPERVILDVNYNYVYDRQAYTTLPSGSPNRINKAFDFYTNIAPFSVSRFAIRASATFNDTTSQVSNSATGSLSFVHYVYGQSGSTDWYDVYNYSFNLGVIETITNLNSGLTNGSGSIRFELDRANPNYVLVYANGSSTAQVITGPTVTYVQRVNYPTFNPFPNNTRPNAEFGGWPPVLFPTVSSLTSEAYGQPTRTLNELSIASSTINNQTYTPYYWNKFTVADLKSLNFAELTAVGISVVNIQPKTLNAQFNWQADATIVKRVSAEISSDSTWSASGQLVSAGQAQIASIAEITVQGQIITSVDTDLSANFAQTATAVRNRLLSSNLSVNSDITVTAVKTSSQSSSISSQAQQSTEILRQRNTSSELTAFYSQLTAAFRNATGTILLESSFQQSTTAVKTTDITKDLVIVADQTTAVDRIRYGQSDLASEFGFNTEGVPIRPASASLVSTAGLVCDIAKVVGYSADLNSEFNDQTDIDRIRESQSSLESQFQQIQTVDLFKGTFVDLTVTADWFASPTFVVRITAEFTAFYSQLTVSGIINLDPALTLLIKPETRALAILPETRVYAVYGETRVLTITKG